MIGSQRALPTWYEEAMFTASRDRFRKLADEWYETRPKGADVSEICHHFAYLSVIGMGALAIPHILRELQTRPEHWFVALRSICGGGPEIPESSRGKLHEMSAAWVAWGQDFGFVPKDSPSPIEATAKGPS